MRHGRIAALAIASVAGVLATVPRAWADGTVNVVLEDASVGENLSGMKMIATPDSVRSGRITIHATNSSNALVHEVIVVRAPANGALPYDDRQGAVIEKRIKDLGEVPDLPAGKSGSITLRLGPGSYLLICNQPNHYKAGMWTRLTVTS